MKPLPYSRSLTFALLLGSLALSGCTSITSMTGVSNPVDHPLVTGGTIKGYVYGGHAPLAGQHVYLLQPGTTGIGSQATSRITAGNNATANMNDPGIPPGAYYVTTDANGAFNIVAGGYTCMTNSSGSSVQADYPAILYAYGGSSTPTGLSTTSAGITTVTNSNNAIVQLATLGSCAGLASLPYVYMNEVSTVATAYAFQGFTPYVPTATTNYATYIGDDNSSQGVTGIVNAATTAGELYSIDGKYTGNVTPPDGEDHIANPSTINLNGIVPQAEIDTLANILANCVDVGGGTGTGAANSACTNLFALATNTGAAGGIQAKDTATAMIDIARHPSGAASSTFAGSLYDLQPTAASDPFSPYLTGAPNDFTLGILYRAVNNVDADGNDYLTSAESVEVDGVGNVWITAQGNTDTFQWNSQGFLGTNNVDSSGYIYGYVSIDGSNNAWTGAASTSQGIEEYSSNGQYIQTYGSGYGDAYTLMTNQAGDAFFIANTTGTDVTTPPGCGGFRNPCTTTDYYQLFEYGPGGAAITGSPFTISPGAITAGDNVGHGAIDHDGDLWLTTESSYQIARVSTAAGTQGNKAFTSITVPQQPEFVAINNAGNAIIPIQSGDSASGTAAADLVPGAYVVTPAGGTTTLYSGTYPGPCTGRNCTSAPAPGANVVYTGANFVSAFGAAIDGNNNIWIANRCFLDSSPNSSNLCPTGAKPAVPVGADSITELDGSTYAAISPPTTNYQPSTVLPGAATNKPATILSDSLNLAIDPSGNIWITNYEGSEIVELVGAAAPVVTPLSVAAGTNSFGTTP